MDLRILRYFLTVVREGTITRAADVLHITQPTLSRQLAQLEKDLGIKLFEHQGRRVVLTPNGFLLRRRAEELLELAEKTEQELTHSEETVHGTVSIGYGEIGAMNHLARCISDFCDLYPLVRFSLFSGTAPEIRERMDRGLADLGLLLDPVETDEYDYVRMNCTERHAAFMRPDDPLAQKERLFPEDFAGKPLILSRRGLNSIRNWMGSHFQEENVRYMINLPTMGAVLAAEGKGYMLVIEDCLPLRDPTKLVARPLAGYQESHSLLAWKHNQPFSQATTRFIEHVKMFWGTVI